MRETSIFENFNKVKEQIELEEMLNRIKLCIYGYLIRPLRRLLKEGNFKAYDSAKRGLPAFTPSARFVGGRKMQYMVKYNSIIVLDFDKLSEDELIRIKEIICLCYYTLACFVSPSGNGLKVLVCVSTGAGEHLNAFISVQQYYMALTGVEIDSSGKDITRLCFVSMDPELYYNPGATVFDPIKGDEDMWPPAKPDLPLLKSSVRANEEIPIWASLSPVSTEETLGVNDIYNRCIAYVERHCSFIEGFRNTFVFALALQLRRAGLQDAVTIMLLLQDYNYNESEVRNSVKSAYSYIWMDEATTVPNQASGVKPVEATTVPIQASETEPVETVIVPPKKEKKGGRKHYNIKKVEELLTLWFEMRYNEVTGVVEWRHTKSRELFKRLDDHDENSMFRRLHHADQDIPLNILHALINSDYSPDYNPFTSYFKKLPKWDGVTDYIDQISRTVTTDDDPYWAFCFRKWFVAYVASLIEDEIINHTVIVFIGIQGVGKTSWMKLLVPQAFKNYLGTAALQTDSKDTAIQLSECALIILDEMENLNRKDLSSFKELITRPEIRIRRPYGRNSENLPHRASFIASVNYQQILTDPSGSRRYLCSKVNYLDYKHTVDIDGAMAQAYALFRNGFKFWFDQDEIKELTDRNEDFMSKTVEEEMIETWFRPVTRIEWDTRNQFVNGLNIQLMTATQIAIKLLEKAKLTLGDNTLVKIGRAMHKLQYERVRKKNNYQYMLRVIDADVVERDCRTLDGIEDVAKEDLTPSKPDLYHNNNEDQLPF